MADSQIDRNGPQACGGECGATLRCSCAIALVGTVLSVLLVGYEPVGGDPDRLYRPLKSELARAPQGGPATVLEQSLRAWCSARRREPRRGILSTESFASISSLDVSLAYRLSMWLHYVAVVGTTYVYARAR